MGITSQDQNLVQKIPYIPRIILTSESPLILMSLCQLAKKVVSDGLGLVDFAIGLVNFVCNLPSGQMKCFGEFK